MIPFVSNNCFCSLTLHVKRLCYFLRTAPSHAHQAVTGSWLHGRFYTDSRRQTRQHRRTKHEPGETHIKPM